MKLKNSLEATNNLRGVLLKNLFVCSSLCLQRFLLSFLSSLKGASERNKRSERERERETERKKRERNNQASQRLFLKIFLAVTSSWPRIILLTERNNNPQNKNQIIVRLNLHVNQRRCNTGNNQQLINFYCRFASAQDLLLLLFSWRISSWDWRSFWRTTCDY